MRKKTTFLKSVLAILLLFGSMIVNAQIDEVWSQTHDWNTAKDYRGIAYNPDNNHLYVAGTPGSSANANDPEQNYLRILDASTGNLLKTLTLDTIDVVRDNGNGFGIRDVAVSSDGGIFAHCATLNTYNLLKIYYWANEDAKAVVLWELPQPPAVTSEDFGTGFSIYGDITDDALILIPLENAASVWYLEITDGVLDPVYKELTLTGITAGASASAEALGTSITDGFWYNNASLQEPSLINGTGNIIGAIDGALFTGTTGDVKPFSAGTKDYLIVSNAGNIQLIDVTGKAADYSDVVIGDFTQIDGTDTEHPSGWGSQAYGYGQEQTVVGYSNGAYVIHSLSGGNYVKAVAPESAPFALDVLMTGFAMVDSLAQVSYTYLDINGDLEGTSLFSWFVSDDDQGTNKTEVGTDASYTVKYADLDKYLSVSVLPVALTGTASDVANKVETSYAKITASAHKPVASDLAIDGAPEVYGLLTGSYTYTDDDDDAEAESILKWWRADDATGTNAIEVASDTLKYKPMPADTNKFIIFSVIPVSDSPNLSEGDSVAVATAVVTFPAFAPVASNVKIDGIEEVSRILTGTYDYSDLNEDLEGASVLTWYRADAADGTKVTVATDTNMYELVAADEAKYIFFGVKPVTVGGEEGVEVFDTTGVIAPKPAESAPIASDVVVNGTPEVGAVLSGDYTYFDYTDDPEGVTIFKWYVADDAAGTNPVVIEGASDQTLLVAEAQLGKFIIFEVTPVAISGGALVGDPVPDTTLTATVASSHEFGLERMWLASTKTGAAPFYINPAVTTERGFAIGEDHMYIASRYNGTKVVMVNKEDGSYAGELSTEGIEGGIYAINDVEVSDDGQILAAPLVADGTFWIYKWENELADPVKWLDITLEKSWRLGDKFSVTGDLTGDAIIMAVASGTNKIIRWVITGGIAAAADTVTLNGITSAQTSPAAVPFAPNADANILVDGKGFAPTIFDKDGNIVGTVDMIDNYGAYKIQSNSPNVFNYKGRTMAAFFQAMRKEPLGARIIVADITSQPYQIVDSTEYISNSMAWDGYLGEVDVTVDDEYYHAYMLQAKNAVARYRGILELPEFVEANTTFEGDKLMATFTMSLNDTTVAATSVWTIMAGDAEVAIDTIYSVDAELTFELTTAITEGQVVTITYDGLGSVVSFNGMPLSAFGPESVLNIVGADVPVATNVSIDGTLQTGQMVTGTYTFNDPDGDLEGESEYQWYYATDVDGTDKLKVIGGTDLTYTIADDMKDKYIAFEVTPVSTTGGDDYLVGEPTMSAFMLVEGIGVNDDFAAQVTMYPNPANSVLNIDNCNDVTTVNVLDYTGRVVMVITNNGDTKLTINISDLNSGVYLVQLNGVQGESTVKRIVKN